MLLRSLLGSDSLQRLIVHFVARPESRLHFRALGRRLGLSRQSLRNALDTLGRLGLVRAVPNGQRVHYEATDHPGWQILRDLVRTFAAPAEIVGDLLQGVRGVQAAGVFGSAVTGQMRADSDVDVLVVSEGADAGDLGAAVAEAGLVLGRDIDLKRYRPHEIRAEQQRPGTSYIKRVLDGPIDWIIEPTPGGQLV